MAKKELVGFLISPVGKHRLEMKFDAKMAEDYIVETKINLCKLRLDCKGHF